MGKISPVSYKYIINAYFEANAVVDKPDVIGAIFGQTEGLLGEELELRELQQNGRIGRIEVELETKNGKSSGIITIPSSMDKAETSIIAAALEVIQRIGPCEAKVKVTSIEDVRSNKRNLIFERAKEILKKLVETTQVDSQEIINKLVESVRTLECVEYGRERLTAGPGIDESEEIIVVEGRADVINLLKHGIKNVIAMNGTKCPRTIIDLSKKKQICAFVDGDRGGDLIIKELLNVADVDYIAKAPDGKEVEELTKKEILKCLRAKISVDQLDFYSEIKEKAKKQTKPDQEKIQEKPTRFYQPTPEEKNKLSKVLESIIGTRAAALLNEKLEILGKIPLNELESTLRSVKGAIHSVVIDGKLSRSIYEAAERAKVKNILALDSEENFKGATNLILYNF